MGQLVLLVEDDADIRTDLAELLRSEDYEVVTASNGQEALDYLRRRGQRPSLILLDLMMPVMDGWTLRSKLLAEPDLSDIPVILLSGAADVQNEAVTLKAADYLRKPFNLDRLLAVISTYC